MNPVHQIGNLALSSAIKVVRRNPAVAPSYILELDAIAQTFDNYNNRFNWVACAMMDLFVEWKANQ